MVARGRSTLTKEGQPDGLWPKGCKANLGLGRIGRHLHLAYAIRLVDVCLGTCSPSSAFGAA
eukprot:1131408-Pelagomonas_calceolata.AAC.2